MAYENRRYLILTAEQVATVNFNQVMQESLDVCRYSVDGTKTFVKYNITVVEEDLEKTYFDVEENKDVAYTQPAGTYGRPSVYTDSMTEYTHSEMITILNTEEWAPYTADMTL